jgi:hypothetical protein
MPRSFLVSLRLVDAYAGDYARLVVRIHNDDKPKGIRWYRYISIALDGKYWITSKVEPSGATGKVKIYVNPHLRGLLNNTAVDGPIAQLGMPCSLYIRKTPAWKEALYIMRHHPDDTLRAKTLLEVCLAVIAVTAGILVALLASFFLLDLTGLWQW